MICILSLRPKDHVTFGATQDEWQQRIGGWIIATDTHDARRQAQGVGEPFLAGYFYTREWLAPGRYPVTDLSTQRDYLILVMNIRIVTALYPFSINSDGGYFGRIYWSNAYLGSTQFNYSRIRGSVWGLVGWDDEWPYSLAHLLRVTTSRRVLLRTLDSAFAAIRAAAGEASTAFKNYSVYYHKQDDGQ